MRQLVEVDRQQQCAAAHACGCIGSLAAGVARTYHNHIVEGCRSIHSHYYIRYSAAPGELQSRANTVQARITHLSCAMMALLGRIIGTILYHTSVCLYPAG